MSRGGVRNRCLVVGTTLLVCWAWLTPQGQAAAAGLGADRAVKVTEQAEQALGGEVPERDAFIDFMGTRYDANLVEAAGVIVSPPPVVPFEVRQGLTPEGVYVLKKVIGIPNDILLRQGTGVDQKGKQIFSDQAYRNAGANVLSCTMFRKTLKTPIARVVVSIKEPQQSEEYIIKGADPLLTYIHAAFGDMELVNRMGLPETAVAMETMGYDARTNGVRTHHLPLLAPASDAAGYLASVRFGVFQDALNNGMDPNGELSETQQCILEDRFRKRILTYPGPVDSVMSGALEGKRMLVLGGGVVGEAAARAALEMGAMVTVTEVSSARMDALKRGLGVEYGKRFEVLERQPKTRIDADGMIERRLRDAHGLIGAVLHPGGRAPVEVSEALYRDLRKRGNLSYMSDVAIDQGTPEGGNILMGLPSGHKRDFKYSDGWPLRQGGNALEFVVTNMPSALPKQVSDGLMRAKLPYLVYLLHGVEGAIGHSRTVERGLNFVGGHITHQDVALIHKLPYLLPRVAFHRRRAQLARQR